MSKQSLNIGFIGLGIMGTPMAGHLAAAGHKLFVNTRGQTPEALQQAGVTRCPSNKAVAQAAEIIIVMVPDTPDVGQVLLGEGGVAEGLSKGKLVIDMSSISPVETKEYAAKIEALGCDYLDAPVSGGDVGARNATLSIMCGGKPAAFERARPVLSRFGALRDGSLKALFDSHYGAAIRAADIANRRVIRLHNPLLPTELPLAHADWWWQPEEAKSSPPPPAMPAPQRSTPAGRKPGGAASAPAAGLGGRPSSG